MAAYLFFDTVRLNPATGGVLNVSAMLLSHMRASGGQHRVEPVSERFPRLYRLFDRLRLSRFILDTLLYNYQLLRSALLREQVLCVFPNYFLPQAAFGRHADSIVIVHDLQYKYFPAYFGPRKVRWLDWCLKRIARSASNVVFISESSQKDFAKFFGPCARSTVILNPVDAGVAAPASSDEKPERFLIAAYHYYPHKNFAGVLRLFRAMRERGLVDTLHVTGDGAAKVEQIIRQHAPELRAQIVLRGKVERRVLVDLFRRSVAFVSMSTFEGFNLSAAEAATLGVPVLLSDIPVHEELFAEYGCLVDAERPDLARIEQYLQSHRRQRPQWAHAARCKPATVAAHYLTLKA
ncbi:glycosyltransferase [Xylophilus sp. GOD-11R]|uniref:glycosyltransferase n=1 Tax=Xylophilus sp. GOD-11R TaxID=3089814 RepID=UPI00298D16A3|nr:glycosyltransferase [Xylophilus sp. GOD-11R]WPB55485.1 glycosyltransferase [Xylophilus sp. GOD-11R]